MHVVVNYLRFRERVDPALFAEAQSSLAERMRAINGFPGFHVVQPAEDRVNDAV